MINIGYTKWINARIMLISKLELFEKIINKIKETKYHYHILSAAFVFPPQAQNKAKSTSKQPLHTKISVLNK